MTINIIKNNGVLALYNGLSATFLRSATYSTSRFAFYELCKLNLIKGQNKTSLEGNKRNEIPFYQKILIAGIGGGLSAIIGKLKLNSFCKFRLKAIEELSNLPNSFK